MGIDRLIDFAIEEAEGKHRLPRPSGFVFRRAAGLLIEPAKKCAMHHREREKFHTKALEEAEAELRAHGVTIEVYDPKTGTVMEQPMGPVVSGALCSGAIGSFHFGNSPNLSNISQMPKFQPKVNPEMMNRVEQAKIKMLDHRSKAEQYEKYARAFRCDPTVILELGVEDAYYFRLEE